ncbi:MAG: polyprenyl synthetase family protein [Alphaproteobacteria bacterium]|nr:polyprenyl synthetase family protein [Polyangiaceae bacterium]MCB9764777.1 polyprenyl synthetase family protein [Alphaproteobacteria bacterium]
MPDAVTRTSPLRLTSSSDTRAWTQWRDAQLAQVDAHMRRIASGPSPFDAPAHYMLATPGKRLRPRLLLGWYAVCAASWGGDAAARAGAAVELLHEASLIHDDVCDRGLVRRGVPSMAEAFGVRRAGLYGYYLIARCAGELGRVFSETAILELQPTNAGQFETLLQGLPCPDPVEGQLLESLPPNADLAMEKVNYELRCLGKTSVLFMMACEFGALLGSTEAQRPTNRAHARRFAQPLGLAFQLLDDVLDIEASVRLARPAGADLSAGVLSWPILDWAHHCADPAAALGQFGDPRRTEADHRRLRAEIIDSGACERARALIRERLDEARAALRHHQGPPAHDLGHVLDWLEEQ